MSFSMGFPLPATAWQGGGGPSLNLDFINSSKLDPRITFSRGTQAMQYGLDGTLQYAPNNLLTYSNQADNAAWTKSNSFVQQNLIFYSEQFENAFWASSGSITTAVVANTAISPIGTLTADTATFNVTTPIVRSQPSALITNGTPYTLSVWVKASSSGGAANVRLTVNNSANWTGALSNKVALTSEWQRISLTWTSSATTLYFIIGASDNTGAVDATCYGNVDVWGAQLVQGSVPGDYVATTSAALPVLYADYNGALRARKLCEDATVTAQHRVYESASQTAGVPYTWSMYVKSGERTAARLVMGGTPFGVDVGADFNLATGTKTGDVNSPTSATITSIGGGWYRLVVTAIATVTGGGFAILTIDNPAGTNAYTGDGSSGVYIADAQLTPGYLPLAVTETTSAAVYGPRFDYDPSSLVAQNLLLYSEQFDLVATWPSVNLSVTPNASISPTGVVSADRAIVVANSTYTFIREVVTVSPSTTYTFSFWLNTTTSAASNTIRIYNLTASADIVAGQACVYSSGWVRQTCTFTTPAGCTSIAVYPVSFNAGVSSAGLFLDIWGAQLNTGSTALPYTATTTAPYTLTTARGLLIEEQRTNLLLQSNDFQTSWTPTNITRTLNSTLSPEGVVNGVKLEATAAAATALYQQITSTSTSHTFSVYVKQGTGATTANNFIVRNITTLTNLLQVTLNYSTGVVTYVTGSTGASAVSVGNGWWRLQLSVTAGITVGDLVAGYVGFTGGAFTAGDFLYAYGAQLEAGAFATSYIPTVGSTATRNADSATIPAGTWYNTAAGTWYFNGETQTFPRYLIVDNSGAAKYPMYVHSAAGGIGNFDGTNLTLTGNNTTARTTFKAATTYSGSVATAVLNGGTVATGTYNGAFSTIATFKLGGATGAGGEIDGHIQSIRFYPTALSSVSQQSITV